MKKSLCLMAAVLLSGCAAEVGSERWCGQMEEKPKGEWTANEGADYARHCIIRVNKSEG